MHYVLRVSLPDSAGAMHAVTGVCGATGIDIVSLNVVERGGGFVVDELCLTGVDDPGPLRGAIDDLPGTVVTVLRPVTSQRDVDGPIVLAAALVAQGRGAVRFLVDRLPAALWASWAVAVANGWSGMEVLAASNGALPPTRGGWLPLTTARRLDPLDLSGDTGWDHDLEIAAAPLGQTTSAVLVARRGGPRFVDSEQRQLQLLAGVAVATEVVHTPRRPVERIAPLPRTPVGSSQS